MGNIQLHPFFKTINWQALERREVEPPFKPKVVRPTHVTKDFVEITMDHMLCTFIAYVS